MNVKVFLVVFLVASLGISTVSRAVDFVDYYPIQMGGVWTFQGVLNPANTLVDSVCCLQEIDGQPAVLLGAEGGLQFICWNDGAAVTWYGAIFEGVEFDFEPDAVLGDLEDGDKVYFCTSGCDSSLFRLWDQLDPDLVGIYDIDPSYGDLVVWAFYDADEDPNFHNVMIESNLPAGINPPPGAITDLEWYQEGVGRTVYMEIEASTGAVEEKYVLTSYVVDVDDHPVEPRGMQLHQNSPNPFNPVTRISFYLSVSQHVHMAIYSLDGRLISTLASESMPAGHHEVTWTGRDESGHDVASGSYIYRLEAGGYSAVKRMVLIR